MATEVNFSWENDFRSTNQQIHCVHKNDQIPVDLEKNYYPSLHNMVIVSIIYDKNILICYKRRRMKVFLKDFLIQYTSWTILKYSNSRKKKNYSVYYHCNNLKETVLEFSLIIIVKVNKVISHFLSFRNELPQSEGQIHPIFGTFTHWY